jgi:hypothetical protein
MVMRWVQPLEEAGSSPTRSILRWLICCVVLAIGWGRHRQLTGHLSLLAMLAVPIPHCHLICQAGPNKAAGDEAACGPDARVSQAVNGIEDLPAKNS